MSLQWLKFFENCITFLFLVFGMFLLKIIYINFKKLFVKIKEKKGERNNV